jgi:hypothetical protein
MVPGAGGVGSMQLVRLRRRFEAIERRPAMRDALSRIRCIWSY